MNVLYDVARGNKTAHDDTGIESVAHCISAEREIVVIFVCQPKATFYLENLVLGTVVFETRYLSVAHLGTCLVDLRHRIFGFCVANVFLPRLDAGAGAGGGADADDVYVSFQKSYPLHPRP